MKIHVSVQMQKNPKDRSYIGVLALVENCRKAPCGIYTFDIFYDEREKMTLIIYSNDSQEICTVKNDVPFLLHVHDRSCVDAYAYLVLFIFGAARFRLQNKKNLDEPRLTKADYELPNDDAQINFQKLINQ